MLRHLDRIIVNVNAKVDGKMDVAAQEKLIDLSGGSLSQSLCKVDSIAPIPLNNSFTFITPSAGFESSSKLKIQHDILEMFGGHYVDMLWASSGSDAVESAIWAVDTFFKHEFGQPLSTFVVRRGGYHGNTFLCRELSLRSVGDEPLKKGVVIIDENESAQENRFNEYAPYDAEVSASSLLDCLKKTVSRGGITFPAVMILEGYPTSGWRFFYTPSEYQDVFEYCRANQIITIVDDVASGFYRHGRPSSVMSNVASDNQASQSQQLYPDVLVLSKGLTSGAYPLSCCLLNMRLVEAIRASQKKPLTFTHGLTEAAALLAINCVTKYKEIFSSRTSIERNLFISNIVGLNRRQLLKNDIGIECTETSIRLDVSNELGEKLTSKLSKNHMWVYVARAKLLCGRDKFRSRNFLHICPPFDIPLSEQIELFDQFKTNLLPI